MIKLYLVIALACIPNCVEFFSTGFSAQPSAVYNSFGSSCKGVCDKVSNLLSQSPGTNCALNLIPTFFLKQCSRVLQPTITLHHQSVYFQFNQRIS